MGSDSNLTVEELRAELAALREEAAFRLKLARTLMEERDDARRELREARALLARVFDHMARNGLGWDPAWTAEYNRLAGSRAEVQRCTCLSTECPDQRRDEGLRPFDVKVNVETSAVSAEYGRGRCEHGERFNFPCRPCIQKNTTRDEGPRVVLHKAEDGTVTSVSHPFSARDEARQCDCGADWSPESETHAKTCPARAAPPKPTKP